MGFNSTFSAGQLTSLRAAYGASQYLAVCPNTTVFAARVNQASFASTFAQVTYDTVTTGAYTSIRNGQTVFIGSTSDIRSASFRGRVRKTPTSSILYINETSASLADNYYITVIDDFDVFEKLQRIGSDGTFYKDYDLTFRKPRPAISGIQSTYILPTTGASATQAFTPTVTAMASGATISSYLWDVRDGTITVGTSSTLNITASFPSGHRWVSLKATDSNGNAQTFYFEVYCGNPDSASWSYRITDGASITGSLDGGYSASIRAFSGFDSLVDQTRVTLFTVENFGTTIINNIDLVGRFRSENDNTSGDETYASVSDLGLEIEGLSYQLARINIPSIEASYNTAPTVWGEMTNPTPARAIWYGIDEHTTYGSVAGFAIPSDDSSYVYPSYNLYGASALDMVSELAGVYHGAMEFSPDGQSRIVRNANYLDSTARNALSTIITFQTTDMLSYSVSRGYGYEVGETLLGAGAYTTTTNTVTAYTAKAPAIASLGAQEYNELNGLILKHDQTEANTISELSSRSANHLAYINPKYRIDATLPDSFRCLVPSRGYWFAFAITSSDNLRGVNLSSYRWQLIDISYDANHEDGTYSVRATFEIETTSTGSQIVVAKVPSASELDNPILPTFPEYPTLGYDADLLYPTTPVNGSQWVTTDIWQPLLTVPADIIPPYPSNPACELLAVPMWSSTAVTTSFSSTLGDDYTIRIQGQGIISATEYGDAFYHYQYQNGGASSYGSGDGLLLDGADLSYPDYTPNHVYEMTITGTGSPFSFNFVDASYADNSQNLIYVTVCPNEGVTPVVFDVSWLAALPLTAPVLNSGDILTATRSLNDGPVLFIGYGQYIGGPSVNLSTSTVSIAHAVPRLVNSIGLSLYVNDTGGTRTAYTKHDSTTVNHTVADTAFMQTFTVTFGSPTFVSNIEFYVSALQTFSGSYVGGFTIDYAV